MRKYFFILLSLFPLLAAAQTETDIRNYYADINKKIEESANMSYEGHLYNNHWVTNKNGKSWPATGRFTATTDFWYDDPPDHLGAADRDPKNVLIKVTTSRKTVDYSASEEYLYKDGKLLFFYSHTREEDRVWDTRVYFNDKGDVIKNSVTANGKELTAADLDTEENSDAKPHPAMILEEAKKMQALFLQSM